MLVTTEIGDRRNNGLSKIYHSRTSYSTHNLVYVYKRERERERRGERERERGGEREGEGGERERE